MKKNKTFADVVKTKIYEPELARMSVNKILTQTEDNSRFIRPKFLRKKTNYVDEVVINLDDQLSKEWKTKFKNLCLEFTDTIDPSPGRYNGHFGDIDNLIDFLSCLV